MDPKDVVRRGYERAASVYDEWSTTVDAGPRDRYLALLDELLEPQATVLELGCGTGLATRALTDRFRVVGVDFATTCLRLARPSAPRGRYVQADMTRLCFRPGSFDAVVAFYSLIHVPREEQGGVLRTAAGILRPGGLLLLTMGADDLPAGTDDDWRGVPMYWSSYDRDANVAAVRNAGFAVLWADVVTQWEDDREVSFLWVVARRPD